MPWKQCPPYCPDSMLCRRMRPAETAHDLWHELDPLISLAYLRRSDSHCGHSPCAVSRGRSLMPLCRKASAPCKAPRKAGDSLFTRTPTPSLSLSLFRFLPCEIEGRQWVRGVMPPSFMLSALSSHDGEARQSYYFVIVIWPQNAAHPLKPWLLNYFSLTVC